MPTLEDFKKLTNADVLFFLVSVTSVLSPGVLVIWYFWPELFLQLDTSKLLISSVAATLPLTCLHSGLVGNNLPDSMQDSVKASIVLGAFLTIISISLNLYLSVRYSLTFKQFFWNVEKTEVYIILAVGGLVPFVLWCKRKFGSKSKKPAKA